MSYRKGINLFILLAVSLFVLVTSSFAYSASRNGTGPGLNSASADPLDTWLWRNPLPQGDNIWTVAYGNGIFVAAGYRGAVLTSTDGITWTARDSGTDYGISGIAYGNGIFVAVGYGRDPSTGRSRMAILTSPNGVKWTDVSPETAGYLPGITFGKGMFIAVGYKPGLGG